MDDFRDLMYDMILESLEAYVESDELDIDDADMISEAAYDELFGDDEDDDYDEYDESFSDKWNERQDKKVEKSIDKRIAKGVRGLRKQHAPQDFIDDFKSTYKKNAMNEYNNNDELKERLRKSGKRGDIAAAGLGTAGLAAASVLGYKYLKSKKLKAKLADMSDKELKALIADEETPSKVVTAASAELESRPTMGQKIRDKANQVKDSAKSKVSDLRSKLSKKDSEE